MNWGAVMVLWVCWMLLPVVLGELFAFLLSDRVYPTRADIHARARDEYAHMQLVLPVVWFVEAGSNWLGRFGVAFRLSLWPLWFVNLWLIVEGSKQRPWRPWR